MVIIILEINSEERNVEMVCSIIVLPFSFEYCLGFNELNLLPVPAAGIIA